MRKMVLILVALLVAFAFTAFAQSQLEVWKWVDGNWVHISDDASDVEADAWAFSLGGAEGKCNKQVWSFDAEVEVQVAQWIDFHLTGTKWAWYVRKPGTYLTDCITANIKSNGEVAVSFTGLASPTYQGPYTTVKDYIDMWVGYGSSNDNIQFVAASDLANLNFIIPDNNQLHYGFETKLWSKIFVAECNSASTYRTSGQVILTLQRIKDWIDPETGFFRPDYNYTELPGQPQEE